jgi:hypothetical protein
MATRKTPFQDEIPVKVLTHEEEVARMFGDPGNWGELIRPHFGALQRRKPVVDERGRLIGGPPDAEDDPPMPELRLFGYGDEEEDKVST